MKWFSRKIDNLAVVVVALLFAVVLGQFPQYLAQYMQRLGGHIDEATLVSQRYNVEEIKGRLDTLQISYNEIKQASGLKQLFAFIKHKDNDIAQKAYENYTPGITFDKEGILFFGIGALIGFILYELLKDFLLLIFGGSSRRKRKRSVY